MADDALLNGVDAEAEAASDWDVLVLQMARFNRARDAYNQWSEEALRCLDYFEGNQWSTEAKQKLADEGRPITTFNRISPLVRAVYGFFLQTQAMPVVKPNFLDSQSNRNTAEAIGKVLAVTDEANSSAAIQACMFFDGITTGRGYVDIRLGFDDNILGEITEKQLDPFSVWPDPDATSYDPKDWGFVVYSEWMSADEIAQAYPMTAKQLNDRVGPDSGRNNGILDDSAPEYRPRRGFARYDEWDRGDTYTYGFGMSSSVVDHLDRTRKLIRVVTVQHRVLVTVPHIVDLDTGDMREVPAEWSDAKLQKAMKWAQYRGLNWTVMDRPKKRVRITVTAMDKVLYDDWSIYDDFTIVPYFAYFNQGKTRGMIDDLVSPQDEYNKRRSSLIHIAMTAANSGWSVEKGSLDEENLEALESEGSRPGLVVQHELGRNPPRRIEPGAPPALIERLMSMAAADMKEVSGINDSALGNLDKVQSGVALENRVRQALVGAQLYFDNMKRTREMIARVKLNIIQRHYTEMRVFRYLGEDGDEQEVVINNQEAASDLINDVTLGRYKVTIDEAPAASTFDRTQFNELFAMAQQIPGFGPLAADVLVDLSNVPQRDKLKQRMSSLIGAQVAQSDVAIKGANMQMMQMDMQMAMAMPGMGPGGPPGSGGPPPPGQSPGPSSGPSPDGLGAGSPPPGPAAPPMPPPGM